MNTSTTSINDDWNDLKTGEIKNIRVKGTYPHVHKKQHHLYESHFHPNCSPFLMNQHKPHGIATVGLLDPFDDRPDWFLFKSRKNKRIYEEITPADHEEFGKAMMWLLEDKPLIPNWLENDMKKITDIKLIDIEENEDVKE